MKKKYVLDFANISSELYQLCSKKELTRRKCLNLGKMECNLLYHLSNVDDPQCMNDLAKALGVSHSRITRIVDNLVYKKFVRRFPSPTDRRSWIVELTPEGAKANDESVDDFLGIQMDILKEIPANKIQTVLESVTLYINSYQKALNKRQEEQINGDK